MAADKTPVLEVVALLTSGFEKSESATALRAIRPSADTVVFGTDRAEEWYGFDQLVDPFKVMASSIVGPSYSWCAPGPRVSLRGSVAWVVGALSLEYGVPSAREVLRMRTTLVLSRDEDGGAIDHAHFSCGVEEGPQFAAR